MKCPIYKIHNYTSIEARQLERKSTAFSSHPALDLKTCFVIGQKINWKCQGSYTLPLFRFSFSLSLSFSLCFSPSLIHIGLSFYTSLL